MITNGGVARSNLRSDLAQGWFHRPPRGTRQWCTTQPKRSTTASMDSVWQAGLAGLGLLEACGWRYAGTSRLWELQKLHVSEMLNPFELVGTSCWKYLPVRKSRDVKRQRHRIGESTRYFSRLSLQLISEPKSWQSNEPHPQNR